jgi:hypothetical protein
LAYKVASLQISQRLLLRVVLVLQLMVDQAIPIATTSVALFHLTPMMSSVEMAHLRVPLFALAWIMQALMLVLPIR